MGRVEMNQAFPQEYAQDFGPAWQRQVTPMLGTAIVTAMPVDTGNMVLETSVEEFTDNHGRPALRIRGKAKYTQWVDQGTGLFGPLGKYITPSQGKQFLAWTSRSTGKKVFARRTRGQPGQHFFRRALEAVFDRVDEHPYGRGGD